MAGVETVPRKPKVNPKVWRQKKDIGFVDPNSTISHPVRNYVPVRTRKQPKGPTSILGHFDRPVVEEDTADTAYVDEADVTGGQLVALNNVGFGTLVMQDRKDYSSSECRFDPAITRVMTPARESPMVTKEEEMEPSCHHSPTGQKARRTLRSVPPRRTISPSRTAREGIKNLNETGEYLFYDSQLSRPLEEHMDNKGYMRRVCRFNPKSGEE